MRYRGGGPPDRLRVAGQAGCAQGSRRSLPTASPAARTGNWWRQCASARRRARRWITCTSCRPTRPPRAGPGVRTRCRACWSPEYPVRSIARSAIAAGYDVLSADTAMATGDLLEPVPGPARHLTVSPLRARLPSAVTSRCHTTQWHTLELREPPRGPGAAVSRPHCLGNVPPCSGTCVAAEQVHDVLEAHGSHRRGLWPPHRRRNACAGRRSWPTEAEWRVAAECAVALG
jgi:hypothetical protein